MGLATGAVAARLGHRADHAAKRAAVLGVDAARLDLNFLQVFEDGVLARATIDQAVGRHAVHQERVLRAARTVHGETGFDIAGVHAGGCHRNPLERSRLGNPIELFGSHVMGERDALQIDLLLHLAGDVDDLRQRAWLQLGINGKGPAEDHEHVFRRDLLETLQFNGDRVAAGRQIDEAIRPVSPRDRSANGTGLLVGCAHTRAGHWQPAAIGDGAAQASEPFLCTQRRPEHDKCQ